MKKEKKVVNVNYHILKNCVVVNYSGKTFTIELNTKLGSTIIEKIKQGKLQEIADIVDYNEIIRKRSENFFEIKDNAIYSYGEKLPDYLTIKILGFIEQELPFKYLVNFWNNLKQNPSENSKNQLFLFLEANNFPFTEDGHFIAYKRVGEDFKDLHSNSMDNSVGKIVELSRDQVDPDPDRDCSYGLHIAPYNYAQTYASGKLIEVKVNPKDVVAVPTNYHNTKARVCRYEVVGVANDLENPFKDDLIDKDREAKTVDNEIKESKSNNKEAIKSKIRENIKKRNKVKAKEIDESILILGNKKYEIAPVADVSKFDLSQMFKMKKSTYPKAIKKLAVESNNNISDIYRFVYHGEFVYVVILDEITDNNAYILR